MRPTLRFKPAVLAALTLIFTLLVAGSVSAGAAGNGAAKAEKSDGTPSGNPVIFFAADGMRPDLVDKYASQGAMPTMKRPDAQGREGRERSDSRASRPTRGSAGPRSAPARGRVSTARPTTPSTASARATSTTRRASPRPASSRPTTSPSPPSAPARRSSRWSGSARAGSCRRCRDRWSTSAPSSRGRGIVLNYDLPGQPAGANAFGVALPAGRPGRRGGLDQRAGVVQPGEADAVHADELDLRSRRQRDPHLRPLHLRLHQRRHDQLRPRARGTAADAQERRRGRRDPRPGRLEGRQGHARPATARAARRPASTSRRSTSPPTCRSSGSTSPRCSASTRRTTRSARPARPPSRRP